MTEPTQDPPEPPRDELASPTYEVPLRRREREALDTTTRTGLLIVIPLVMAAAAVVGLVFTGMEGKGIYSKPVDELVKAKGAFKGRAVRAEGNLVHGTLQKREQPCEYRFTIEKNGVQVPVRFAQCVVPDTFRDVPDMDVAVTVEGELLADNSFEATSVLAKCPSKYEMKDRAQKGERMPHSATPPPSM
ncbi:MAG: cytochrome c maturation protein CcmE [Myxococcales bacterium]|nr:cytochrome c maturation protein CcmE [Myxococcales bacterium]MBL0195823.1 cytochrome c maturation protein CcmE [Myxococcales bacterium]HQY60114.1 cytochrome c maturation protein CcmE [Polyangiaceae bacterium]